MKRKMLEFMKKETVLCVALMLAVFSMFLVPPDGIYPEYIDFRTLAILFCLMCVMAGLQKIGVFSWSAQKLLKRVKSCSGLVLTLVLLCFFFSMLITNDVALITFVPFAFIVLRMLGTKMENRLILPVVVLQTIAANLGSMLTPIGNPQNLYLYGRRKNDRVPDCALSCIVFALPIGGGAYIALAGSFSRSARYNICDRQEYFYEGGLFTFAYLYSILCFYWKHW